MPREHSAGRPPTRRYTPEEKSPFIRLVGDERDRCEVDLAIGYRAQVETTALGPTLVREELAANKVLAIFARRARDFTDLDAMTRVYPLSDLVELAARKDTRVRPAPVHRGVGVVSAVHAGGPAGEPGRAPAADWRGRRWRRQVERTLERDIDHGHDDPEL